MTYLGYSDVLSLLFSHIIVSHNKTNCRCPLLIMLKINWHGADINVFAFTVIKSPIEHTYEVKLIIITDDNYHSLVSFIAMWFQSCEFLLTNYGIKFTNAVFSVVMQDTRGSIFSLLCTYMNSGTWRIVIFFAI